MLGTYGFKLGTKLRPWDYSVYLSRKAMGPQLGPLGPQLGPRGHNSFLSGYLSRKAMGPQLGPRAHDILFDGYLSRKAMRP